MVFISSCERPFPRVFKPFAIMLGLLVFVLFPDDLVAQGLPTETGSHLPVALWFVGAGVLGLVLAYGIFRNRSRTGAEKQIAEHGTKRRYAEEERDRVRSGSE
jgi:uncharacterized integral membrane protein